MPNIAYYSEQQQEYLITLSDLTAFFIPKDLTQNAVYSPSTLIDPTNEDDDAPDYFPCTANNINTLLSTSDPNNLLPHNVRQHIELHQQAMTAPVEQAAINYPGIPGAASAA